MFIDSFITRNLNQLKHHLLNQIKNELNELFPNILILFLLLYY
jgi:hypothetical protein